MIGLDTNVLVRYIAQDDARQAAQATRLIEAMTREDPGFISTVALAELIWVLKDKYAFSREQIIDVVETLLQSQTFVVQSAATVWKALRVYAASKAEFADHLIERLGSDGGCAMTVTFDKAAARDCGMRLVGAA